MPVSPPRDSGDYRPTAGGVGGTRPNLAARRRVRRERDRRRRRRWRALGALLLVGVAVAVAVVTQAGSTRPAGSVTKGATGSGRRHKRHHHRHVKAGGKGALAGPVAGPLTRTPGTESAPILMYHVINPPPAAARFPGLYVAPAEFAEQMQALHNAGYHAVTMDQLLAYWRHGIPLPAGKPIVLTFDNGYGSQYAHAEPVLARYGWVGVENLQLSGLPVSQGGLSETQVKALIADGWELDTQGYSHADLPALSASELQFQVAASRHTLRRRYHVPVRWFCYPSGAYDSAVEAEVKAAGFVGATTVVPGWASPASDRYRLPRIRVLGNTSASALLSLLRGVREVPAPPSAYQ